MNDKNTHTGHRSRMRQRFLASGQDKPDHAAEPTSANAASQYGFTRGAEYYGRTK